MNRVILILAGLLMGVGAAVDYRAALCGGMGASFAILLYVRHRYGPVLGCAADLAKEHLFGKSVLPERELRALSEAVIIGPRGIKWGLLRMFVPGAAP